MSDTLDEIMQGMLNKADPIVQSVLKVYKTDQDHAVNKEVLSKQTVEYLKSVLLFFRLNTLTMQIKRFIINLH